MEEQACLNTRTQMILPGCPLSQGFAACCGWSQDFLHAMWILGEAWPQVALGLHYPRLATPEGKGKPSFSQDPSRKSQGRTDWFGLGHMLIPGHITMVSGEGHFDWPNLYDIPISVIKEREHIIGSLTQTTYGGKACFFQKKQDSVPEDRE